MKKLTFLVALMMALAVALPGGADAALGGLKKLTASEAQAGDFFGLRVAVSGDHAIVGAIWEDAGGSDAGAAYVFERNQGGPGNWGEVKKLTASDAEAGDNFGYSVAISGDTVIVGACCEDAGGDRAGAAYVFERGQGGADNWGEVKKLTALDAEAHDEFGVSVAISGDVAIVGAMQTISGLVAGAAYIFERGQGGADNWGEVKKLTASDAQGGDFFGGSVAISGDTAIVGALGEDAGGLEAGAAYVFQRDLGGADNWGEVKKLTALDAEADAHFGFGVAMNADTAIVGARSEDAGGGFSDNFGAAYVFERNQGGADNWGEVKKLTASDAQAEDGFGWSVAVSTDTAIVGASGEDTGGLNAGAAYSFERDQGGSGNWGEVKKLTASGAEAGDGFGYSVAISEDTAIVGAFGGDAGGISNAGAAYLFRALNGVGGVAELPEVAGTRLEAPDSSGGSARRLAGTIVGVAAVAVALTGAAWYARRRWARR